MAPSQGPQLFSALWKTTRVFVTKAVDVVKARAPFLKPALQLQPIYAYVPRQGAVNRVLEARQFQRRFFSTARASARRTGDAYRASRVASQISRAAFAKPFASTLRPNLTGGALPRTAGGYALGGRVGGARYFSHGAARPADVVCNVSAGMRAFWLSGTNLKSNGLQDRIRAKRLQIQQQKEKRTHDQKYPTISGSYIDFNISPSLSAFGCFSPFGAPTATSDALEPLTLNSENFMNVLSVDFVRAVKELEMIHADIKRLSALGDLPIKLINSTTLRIRFPGYEQEVVERLCADLGVMRGVVGQDEDFEVQHGSHIALQYPFAPSSSPSEAPIDEMPELTNMSASRDGDFNYQSVMSSSAAWDTPNGSESGYYLNDTLESNPWAMTDSDSSPSDLIELSALDSSEMNESMLFPYSDDDLRMQIP
ncbi:hypothetical protein AAP_02717 [Ascosphaera apis ARSEF 7405]|uniref:Casein kinase II beta 2 subunit n=1 Tax=Ascosphaera apis ARSEF 7405 TaxID=392613 RepID=A0A167ZGN5_9EURO|nr:hypothetical protein AAP_02717 [Ascosphaera apis ARSEF 7405]